MGYGECIGIIVFFFYGFVEGFGGEFESGGIVIVGIGGVIRCLVFVSGNWGFFNGYFFYFIVFFFLG